MIKIFYISFCIALLIGITCGYLTIRSKFYINSSSGKKEITTRRLDEMNNDLKKLLTRQYEAHQSQYTSVVYIFELDEKVDRQKKLIANVSEEREFQWQNAGLAFVGSFAAISLLSFLIPFRKVS